MTIEKYLGGTPVGFRLSFRQYMLEYQYPGFDFYIQDEAIYIRPGKRIQTISQVDDFFAGIDDWIGISSWTRAEAARVDAILKEKNDAPIQS